MMLTIQGRIYIFMVGIFLMMGLIYYFSGDPNSVPVGLLCFAVSGAAAVFALIDWVLARKE